MDPRLCAQDVLRCSLCETPGPRLLCDICHIHLCEDCVGRHLLDETTEHKVVKFKHMGSIANYPICPNHFTQQCELSCKECDIPICVQCVEHLGHNTIDILKSIETKKEVARKDLQELEKSIYPKYLEIASTISVQKTNFKENHQKLIRALDKQSEDMHREIDTVVKTLKSDVDKMEFTHLFVLNEQEDELKCSINEIKQNMAYLKNLLNSADVNNVSTYKSRNAEFRRLPPKIEVSLPIFIPQKINKELIFQQFGSLSELTIKTDEYGYQLDNLNAMSHLPGRPLTDEPMIISEINTEYGHSNNLHSVSCLSDEDIWTCGQDNIIRLYNLHGKLVNSIRTKSGNQPGDITLTPCGEVVYTDHEDRTVNIVKSTQTQALIRLKRWIPLYVCSTISGDLLVAMISDVLIQARVVRYSGSTEKQVIQFDGNGHSLFSSDDIRYPKYISENKNLDICVSDCIAGAVVVVNDAGKHRFTYTGPPISTKAPFYPIGITTDMQGRILTADINNHCIHILDQDGQFLRYIDECGLLDPCGLCMDTKDILFVAERETGKVKKIKYTI
ncbi:uncharacterized protein LOC128185403 [Crassostrea angulata]|uniref:uncharacterized protein LOC128185403 n=1 Tax=Magallana angulata TaxID=2784310 RepID=UPI0022B093DB|nr:uncharacterized protein LOC128185403 [Crassostrea angulata]